MTPGTAVAEAYAHLLCDTLPHSITNEEDADHVQAQIDALLDKSDLSEAEQHLLSLLGDVMTTWEGSRYDLPDISGPEAIRSLLEDHGLRQKDLVGPVFPTEPIASEVLSGKRRLTYDFVGRLAHFFNVSPALFYPSPE